METVLTSASMAVLILEGIKWVYRKYIIKNPEFNFSQGFYMVSLAVLNVLSIPLLAFLGVEGAIMPTDWVLFTKLVVLTGLSSLVSLVGYDYTIGNLKANIRWNKVIEEEVTDGVG